MLNLCLLLLFLQREELLIEGHIQPAIKIIAEQTTELGNDAGQTAFVNVNHCRMPIGVGIYTRFGVDDGDILEDVLIHVDSFR